MLRCADFEIPLCFVTSISWTKRARTITHGGGYVTARGFEAVEISAKFHIDVATCLQFGFDPQNIFSLIDATVTSRTSTPGIFYLGKFAVYPSVEFALTNINKTYSPDIGLMECDCVWSGVRAAKRVSGESVLEIEPRLQAPKVTLSVDGKSLVLQDFCAITRFVSMPDAVTISATLGNDLDLASRDGFLTKLLNGGIICINFPQGEKTFHVIECDLTDDLLSLTGSVLPPAAMRSVTKTYFDADLADIISDLAALADIECKCLVHGRIDYYCAFGAPMDCIRDLQRAAGFILSWSGNILTCVDVPVSINSDTEIEYIEIDADTDTEQISGCYWYDGINSDKSGIIDKTALRVQSPFRSIEKFAQKCLNFARYQKNSISITGEIMPTIDAHSAVFVRSNDALVQCLVEWYEMDWIEYVMRTELHYVE